MTNTELLAKTDYLASAFYRILSGINSPRHSFYLSDDPTAVKAWDLAVQEVLTLTGHNAYNAVDDLYQ